ncbi:MAG: ATP-dependent zinc metalloprotease FtsH [Planctomycetia bacterium]|nr:ATP-dependent zinc metalloprotease FtsH [Planctomycetia bacterium]
MTEPEKKDNIPSDEKKQEETGTSKRRGNTPPEENPQPGMFRVLMFTLLIGLLLWYFIGLSNANMAEINFGFFRQQLAADNVASVIIQNGTRLTGEFKVPPDDPSSQEKETKGKSDVAKTAKPQEPPKKLPEKFYTILPSPIEAGGELEREISQKVGDKFHIDEPVDTVGYLMILSIIITVVLLGSIWMQFRRTRDQLGGGPMFGFSRSPAKRFQSNEDAVTFKDVAGLESVKEDLAEIVDFLKHPGKFERLGARIPKGVLMCGPPGTGKTLLARAIAGEADVPFFSINASEFIQMFVGVGASRVRDMFDVARGSAPSILFIDEIDAVGRLRGTGIGGGNDEREQTLNQILSEMDGFATNDIVIVIAATNRPDVLDPALLRPGRFDRHVTVSKPAQKGRVQLFEVHTKKVPLAEDVDVQRLAAMTTGLTGADIRNIVNEAALWACRNNEEKVQMADFYYAIDKILMGAKREEVISEEEKRMTAYHEAGHTLMAWLNPGRDRISKVSIIPRGHALGVTQLIPEEDRVSISQREIEVKLLISLGGREAEKLVFDELTAGAEGDLQYVTQLAQKMVTAWGMSSRIGPAAFRLGDEHPFLGKEMSTSRNFSDHTAQVIDEEIMRILNNASEKAAAMLRENRNKLDALAQALEIREELDESQIEQILGPPAYRENEPEKEEG